MSTKTFNMTKKEILDFVVNHIQTNGRAVNEQGFCTYLAYDGRKCAHSICLEHKYVIYIGEAPVDSDQVIEKYGDKVHQEQFRGHEPLFWTKVQRLHDRQQYWFDNTLTEQGTTYLNSILELFPA